MSPTPKREISTPAMLEITKAAGIKKNFTVGPFMATGECGNGGLVGVLHVVAEEEEGGL